MRIDGHGGVASGVFSLGEGGRFTLNRHHHAKSLRTSWTPLLGADSPADRVGRGRSHEPSSQEGEMLWLMWNRLVGS